MRKTTKIIAFRWRGAPVEIGNVSLPVHTVDCQSNQQDCVTMFAIGLDIGYSNLKLAYGEVPDSGTPKPAVTQVLPAGAGRLSDLPLRMGKADGDTDALVVNVNGEKWVAGVDQARLETSVRELHADYPASDAYRGAMRENG